MTDIKTAIRYAMNWCELSGVEIPLSTRTAARKAGMFSKALPGSYESIRATYWAVVYDAIYGYLTSEDTVRVYRNDFRRAMLDAFQFSAEAAYQDGGGDLPLDEDTADWLEGRKSEEMGYIDSMFATMRGLRKEGDADAGQEAFDRADGYTNTLDGIYNQAKAAGAGNQMLTFAGMDGDESCNDCQKYKGQRHRAAWWISHNAVPPNRDFECRGYNCSHRLEDDEGSEFTV